MTERKNLLCRNLIALIRLILMLIQNRRSSGSRITTEGILTYLWVKDYKIVKGGGPGGYEPRFAPVGDGNIDFVSLIPRMQASGAQYFLVEQDDAATMPNTMEQVGRSIRYIKEQL